MDYALPYATDVPPVDGFYQEVRATTNPLGLRGLGECGNPGLGGAIANAVCDALGRTAPISALPLTPARGFEAGGAPAGVKFVIWGGTPIGGSPVALPRSPTNTAPG